MVQWILLILLILDDDGELDCTKYEPTITKEQCEQPGTFDIFRPQSHRRECYDENNGRTILLWDRMCFKYLGKSLRLLSLSKMANVLRKNQVVFRSNQMGLIDFRCLLRTAVGTASVSTQKHDPSTKYTELDVFGR